jgi:hypothetical protein
MADAPVPKSLEDRILLDIERTGFPLELRVSKRFIEAGYHVQNSVFYVDRDEGKGREIEIMALKNSREKGMQGQSPMWIRLRCHVECKKSTAKPWVIFTSEKTFFDDNPGKLQVTGLADTVACTSDLLAPVTAMHPYWGMPRAVAAFMKRFGRKSTSATPVRSSKPSLPS